MKIVRTLAAIYFLAIGGFEVYAQFRNTVFASLGNELISQVIYLSLGFGLIYTAYCLWKNRRGFLPVALGLLCLVGVYSLFSVYILTFNSNELLTGQLQQLIYYLSPILLLFVILRTQPQESDNLIVKKFVHFQLISGRSLAYLVYLIAVLLVLTGIVSVELFQAHLATTNKTLNSILILVIGFIIYASLNISRKKEH